MNGRLYDPLVGRFLSPDNYVQSPDFTQSFNRYAYCINNPLKYTDPSGDIIFTILAAVIPGAQPLLPYAIAMDIGWMSNVLSNLNEIDSFNEGLAYAGVGGAGGLISTIPGWGYWAGSAFTSGGNQFLNTDICRKEKTWSDLTREDAKNVAFSTAIGGASSYIGGQIGDKLAGKMISKLNIKSSFLKYTLAPTIGGGSSGFMDGFFNEIMIGSGDLNTAFKSGGKSAAFSAGSSFLFSSIDYGVNRNVIKARMNTANNGSRNNTNTPYDSYYNPDPAISNGSTPKAFYNSVLFQTPLENWSIDPNFTIWRTIYPNLYNY
jgi:hypothetical protein